MFFIVSSLFDRRKAKNRFSQNFRNREFWQNLEKANAGKRQISEFGLLVENTMKKPKMAGYRSSKISQLFENFNKPAQAGRGKGAGKGFPHPQKDRKAAIP